MMLLMKNTLLTYLSLLIAIHDNSLTKDFPVEKHNPPLSVLTISRAKVRAKIPIIAWIGVLQEYTTIERYREMSEAGITENIVPFSNITSMQAALDIAQKTNIKLYIWCPEMTSAPEETVRRFMNHPALAGYYLQDEPNSANFAQLSTMVKKIKSIDSKHACYVNLLPNYADNNQLGAGSYEEYLERFMSEVPVQMLSFDHYPIIGRQKLDIRPEWFSNLEIVSKIAKKFRKPFWAFALSTEFPPYPSTTLSGLRLQIFSNLAYGAQAIQYFTYWTVDDPGRGDRNAPITNTGDKTPVYAMIREVNKEVKSVSNIFSGAKLISVAHTGNLPPGTKPIKNLPKLIKSISTDGLGAIVSVMKNNRQSYLVVVNRDFTAPMNLTLDCAKGVKRILKTGFSVPEEIGSKTFRLEAGDMIIFKWTS
jgi:hypothetical protein